MNTDMNIQEYIASYAKEVEGELQELFPRLWDIPDVLRQSAQYSIDAGGKRLRPILVLAAAEALGGRKEAAMPVACAIEMVHTYSLIHDDLPAMDNDDYRRGKLTNHKVYGEAMAILAGDALLTQAFYSASQARRHGVPAEQVLNIVEELAEYSGARGMVGGQVADMKGEQGITELSGLEYIHQHKTSDLIMFSLRAGGRVAGADDKQLEALTDFGRSIGLAFQIQDDILDVTGTQEKLGKAVGSDEKQHKVTYPFFIGMEESERRVAQLTDEAKTAIAGGVLPKPQRLLELADYLMKRDR
ncbi:polyprenyl synthetase family protein [Paenibacillus chitinolyticus]|uniref:Farnesyl diphosphate synthase n=2 Tax=Paenibacillus chitinolyticus TaxID=79263 RepID=A0A410WUW7_9BACL|nr:polyprenyl synthetase family protein [Paenibacillus chitinolyticus]